MKKKLRLLIAISICIIVSIPLFAACNKDEPKSDFSDQNFEYCLNSDDGNTVTLSKLKNQGLENATIPSTVTNNGTEYKITQIGQAAFAPTPKGVTIKDMFNYDSKNEESNLTLKSIQFQENSNIKIIQGRAFEKCKAVENLVLPKSLITIKGFAFYKMQNLQTLALPENLTIIDDFAFAYCKNLKKITFETEKADKIPQLGISVFKYYVSKDASIFQSKNPYKVFDNLKIEFKNEAVKQSFINAKNSNDRKIKKWSDYQNHFFVEA